MLEQFLRARLPEQLIALIENLEQNPDASHLDKIDRFLAHDEIEITKFERWMLKRVRRKVADIARRDATLQRAMEIVINAPEEKKTVRYDPNTFMISTGTTNHSLLQQAQNTWTDPRQAFLAGQQRGLF
jgi:hypothetical protein